MQDIIDEAVEQYRRKAFLEGLSDDFRLLRNDSETLKEYEEEMGLWDSTIEDGLANA